MRQPIVARRRERAGGLRRSLRRAPRRLGIESLEERRVLNADAVLDWNAVSLDAVANDTHFATPDQGGPTRTARALAMVHIAMYDAVNAIDGTHAPYLYHSRAPQTANLDAAVAAAAHATLAKLWPQQAAQFDALYQAYLDAIPDGLAEDQGVALGNATARILLDRLGDGSDNDAPYEFAAEPGRHQVDPLHPNQGILTPNWGGVRPFSLESGSQFRSEPPPALDSEAYAAAYDQVRVKGAVDAETSDRDGDGQPDRTAEETEIGLFWAYDGAKGLGTPPRLYNQIARTIAQQQGNTIVENARLFALLNIAQADAGIASWETKYHYDFWRPIVAIRNGDADGNEATAGDANWQPLGAPASNSDNPDGDFTPPFPAYTSGHATFGAATFRTLALFYGTDDIAFEFTSDELNGATRDARGQVRPLATRHFDTLSQATWENAISRIYLGIHWIFDATAGIDQGTAVADHVFANALTPRPVPHDPVLDWNWIALETMRRDSHRATPDMNSPTMSSLTLGFVHTAIYDAVNAIDRTHTRYLFGDPGARGADIGAAVATAAHATLVDLFPSQAAELDAELQAYLQGIAEGAAKELGIDVGLRAAQRLLTARENDGRDLDMDYELSDAPGHHQPDPLHPNQGFLTPKWGQILPFAMTSGDQFRAPPPPALTSAEYAAAYREVLVAGALDAETSDRDGDGQFDRTPEQTVIGIFWGYDGAKNLSTPPRLYNQIVRAVAEQQGNSVVENARLFALVNVAMADAGIASWETKYEYDLWRPIVAIRNGDLDGNPDTPGDPDWRPLGAPASNSGDPDGDFTPPFPAYTSGHATFGAATFRTLERFYGTDDIAFYFQSDEFNGVTRGSNGEIRPAATRYYTSFSQAAEENGQSRIYLGIHWEFDKTLGIAQGSQVADYVFDNKFLPRVAFQNDRYAMDVNDDGALTLGDLLALVRQMRYLQKHGHMDPEFQGFCDVNDDEQLSLADLLDVVSAMRAQRNQPSSEAAAAESHGASDAATATEGERRIAEGGFLIVPPDFGDDFPSASEPKEPPPEEPSDVGEDPPADEQDRLDAVWQDGDFWLDDGWPADDDGQPLDDALGDAGSKPTFFVL